ncbi:MAG: hypothetical protein DI536_17465 [Archangium gephyra]|uniref:Translocation and assembly module TamB C-terminal domain-containing protein n=1 Tax=Archangium gephyra TaxID=48 RepID=A0A2W5TFX7_9BACT|nr:MAG: hypothetical protein DI536_17465 [Archangium gephyra]
MRLSRRRWRQLLGAFAIIMIATILALRTDRAGELVCEELRERLPAALDADVVIGRCAIDPLTLNVSLSRLSVLPHGADVPLATAESASVSLRGLFPGGVALQDVELIKPQVNLTLPLPGPSKPMEGCPLSVLERLRVGSLKIRDGSFSLKLSEQRTVKIDGLSVDASLGRHDAELTLDARGGSVALGGTFGTIRLGKIAVEGSLDLLGETAEVQRAEVNVEGVRLNVTGLVDSLCDARPSLDLSVQTWVPLDAIPRLGVALPDPSGQLLARVHLTGRADDPKAEGEVLGSKIVIGNFTPGDFAVRAALSDKKVVLEEFATRVGDGEVKVSGELRLSQGLPIVAHVETTNASLGHALSRASIKGAWVDVPLSVKGTMTGTLQPAPNLSGDFDFRSGAFILASRAFDGPVSAGSDILAFKQSAGRFKLGVSNQAVTFEDAVVRVGERERTLVNTSVKLWFDSSRGIDVNAVASTIDLSDFGTLAGLPIAGVGDARTTVSVVRSSVQVDAQATMRDMKFANYSLGVVQTPITYRGDTLSFPAIAAQKGQTQYFGDVDLSFRKEGLYTRASVQMPDGRVEDVIDLLADLSPTIQTLRGGVFSGRLSALVAIDSPASRLNGVIAAQLREVDYLDRRLGVGELVANFEDGEALALRPTRFEGPQGVLDLDGRWKFSGPLEFRVNLANGSLAELVDPKSARGLPVGGTFTAHAEIGGTTDLTLINGVVNSGDVQWKGKSLGPLRLGAKAMGRNLEVSGQVIQGLTGALKMSMRDLWPFTATANVSFDDLEPFLPDSAAGVQARLRGDVEVSGPMMEISDAHVSAILNEFFIARGEVSASNVEPVSIAYKAGAIEVNSLKLRGPTTELAAEGVWGPSRVDLKSRGSVDLRLLSTLVSQLERSQGRVDFTAAFSGPVATPALAGSATLTDARFSWRGQDVAVRSLSGRADFSESRVLLQDLNGFLNDGRVHARGDIRLDGLHMKTLEIQTDIEDVSIQVKPDVPVTVSGSLLLASRNAELFQLSGGIDVVKFRYTQPMSLETLIANANEASVPSDSKPNEWLRLDVDLRTAGDVRIENDLARARLAGKLKLTGTNVKPVLSGVVETLEGAQATFRGNTFNVQRGQLQFNGLWPTFDLSAQSQVREYLVTVKAFGRFEDPKVSFSSEPALPDADVLSLLTLGVTSRERLNERAGAGLAAEALMTASGLDQQVQRFLQQNVGLKDQQVRLTTSFNEVTGTAEPAVTWESKVINDNLKVGVVQPVTGRGTKAQLEYRIDQRVSARAQWDNQNQNTSVGNPGIELRFRFEWE